MKCEIANLHSLDTRQGAKKIHELDHRSVISGVPKNVPLSHKELGLVPKNVESIHANMHLFMLFIGQRHVFWTSDKTENRLTPIHW